MTMNPYRSLGSAIGTPEALDLAHRLAAWHDAMVVHRRRAHVFQRDSCEPDCPHVEGQSLWFEALDVYGARAHELSFLRRHGSSAELRSAEPMNGRSGLRVATR